MKEMKIAWPRFEGNEMSDVIAYLYSLSFVGKPGDQDKGKMLFQEKGCSTCHTKMTGTQPIGPELIQMKDITSPIQLIQIMWNHAQQMETKMAEAQMVWPEFSAIEMADLYEFFTNIDTTEE